MLSRPEQAVGAWVAGMATLKSWPATCRKAGNNPFRKALINPSGWPGYAAWFKIDDASTVVVVALYQPFEVDCR